MKVSAKLNNLRIAPRKIRLVTNLTKSLDVKDALDQLDAAIKKGSLPIKKLLESAVSNAENNFGLDRDNLYVLNAIVGAGPTLKRWMPKAFGRAGEIMKRTSSIELILEERVEGKGRKSKEQLEKEKQARVEEKKTAEKERQKNEERVDKKEDEGLQIKAAEKGKGSEKAKKTTEKKSGWGSKIFRRKSM